jgi:hypothetical protein
MSAPLLVLHAFGDAVGGAPWRASLGAGSWPGEWRAPDLPGHGDTPMPAGGCYELTDPAAVGLRALVEAAWSEAPAVVGVGASAVGAELLALGGRATALVLVDGLGGPWAVSAAEVVAGQYAWLRAVADDSAVGQPDPRTAHGYPEPVEREPYARYRASIDVPVLAVATPSSPAPPSEIEDDLAMFGRPADLVRLDSHSPDVVLAAIREWSADLVLE